LIALGSNNGFKTDHRQFLFEFGHRCLEGTLHRVKGFLGTGFELFPCCIPGLPHRRQFVLGRLLFGTQIFDLFFPTESRSSFSF